MRMRSCDICLSLAMGEMNSTGCIKFIRCVRNFFLLELIAYGGLFAFLALADVIVHLQKNVP